jgi:hypothetical protein
MITIVVSGLVSRMVFGKDALYDAMLRANDQQMPGPSLWFNGDNIGVSSVIERRVAEVTCPCNLARFEQALEDKPAWVVLRDEERNAMGVIRYAPARAAFDQLLNQALFDAQAEADRAAKDRQAEAADETSPSEAATSAGEPAAVPTEGATEAEEDASVLATRVRETVVIDPTEISGFYRAADVEVGYTLTQAQRVMREQDVGVLVARRMMGAKQARTLGVMTAAMLEQAIVER